ncbi:MAG TPA: PepSY-like domain-containing protein [Mucilaginibacter sp.]
MKIPVLLLSAVTVFGGSAAAQDIKAKDVPVVVKEALAKKYPKTTKVSWEKEKGNYEANWGGRSGEDTSVQFTPAGVFVEEVDAIPVSQLPETIAHYVKAHYNGTKIREAGKVTNAAGNHLFEAEIKGSDLLFDENGRFIKKD